MTAKTESDLLEYPSYAPSVTSRRSLYSSDPNDDMVSALIRPRQRASTDALFTHSPRRASRDTAALTWTRSCRNADVTPDDDATTVEAIDIGGSNFWLVKSLYQLFMMRQLSNDWHSCGADPPNEVARRSAAFVLNMLHNRNLVPTRVVPSTDEAVCIAFESGTNYADIECYNTGELIAIISKGRGQSEIWDVSQSNLPATIEKIATFLAG